MRRRKSDLLALLILIALPVALFGDVLFLGRVLYDRDLSRYFFGTFRIWREIVLNGEFPYWNPFNGGGQPFAANPELETFYPPHWLLLLPNYPVAFALHLVVHLQLALAGMYLLLRSMKLRLPAAMFGAITFGLSGFLLSYINIPPFLFALSWIPLILLFARRLLLRPNALDFGAAAFLLGMQFLAGEPTTILQTAILIGSYGLYRAAALRQGRLRGAAKNLGLVALLGLCALAIAAVQMLPAADLFSETVRSRGLGFGVIRGWSMPPMRVLELFYPQIMGHRGNGDALYWGIVAYRGWSGPYVQDLYFGAFAALLAVSGLVARVRGSIYAWILACVSYLLAVGDHTPLLKLLFDAGIFRTFRYPEKFVILGIVPLIILSAVVFDRCLSLDRKVLRSMLGVSIVFAASTLAVWLFSLTDAFARLFVSWWEPPSAEAAGMIVGASRSDWMFAVARSLIIVLLIWMASRRISSKGWLIAVGAFVLIDLSLATRDLVPRMPSSYYDPPPATKALAPDKAGYRIFHQADVKEKRLRYPNLWRGDLRYWVFRNALYPRMAGIWSYRTVLEQDYDLTNLLPTVALFESAVETLERRGGDLPEVFLTISNAGYVIRHASSSRTMLIPTHRQELFTPVQIIRIPVTSRYYFADQIVPVQDQREFASLVLGKRIWSRHVAFVAGSGFTPSPGRVLHARESFNSVVLDVESGAGGLLVIGVTPHKFWSVTVDGAPARTIAANIAYQALAVGRGTHRIEMHYHNGLITTGALISASAMALLLGCMFGRRKIGELFGHEQHGSVLLRESSGK